METPPRLPQASVIRLYVPPDEENPLSDTLLPRCDSQETSRPHRDPFAVTMAAHDSVLIILIHLIAISYFALLSIRFLVQEFRSAAPLADVIVPLLYFAGAEVSSLLTIVSHAITLLDRRLATSWAGLERAGVVVRLWCSAVPFVYFQFYGDDRSRWLYIAWLTDAAVRSGVRLLRAPWPSMFSQTQSAISSCAMLGLSALLPAGHARFWGSACRVPMIFHFLKHAALMTGGGLCSLSQLPERWDLLHEWTMGRAAMHVLVVYTAIRYAENLLRVHTSGTVYSMATAHSGHKPGFQEYLNPRIVPTRDP